MCGVRSGKNVQAMAEFVESEQIQKERWDGAIQVGLIARRAAEGGGVMSEPVLLYKGMMLNNPIGYCSEGKWAGWLFAGHPDGQWVSICQLPVSEKTDKESFERDHPELMKLAEEHLEETEQMAERIRELSDSLTICETTSAFRHEEIKKRDQRITALEAENAAVKGKLENGKAVINGLLQECEDLPSDRLMIASANAFLDRLDENEHSVLLDRLKQVSTDLVLVEHERDALRAKLKCALEAIEFVLKCWERSLGATPEQLNQWAKEARHQLEERHGTNRS